MKSTSYYVKPLSVAVLMALSISFSGSVFAVAGKFQFVNGEVQVIEASGVKRTVKKGDSINEGDTVAAAADGFAQLKMEDGGFFAVRPDTQFKVDTFQFSGKDDGSEKGVFSLVKGSLRSVTGLIGKVRRDNYKINTATSVIGIRGSGADVGHSDAIGTAVRTLFGGHSLTSGGKTIETGPGQTALAPPGQEPKIVPSFPFNTSTSAGDKNGGGDKSGDANKSDKSDKAADKGQAENKPAAAAPAAPEVVIPIITTGGTNLTENKESGETVSGGSLTDPTGILAPMGSGGSSVAMVTLTSVDPVTNVNLTYTEGMNSFGVIESGSGFSFSAYLDAAGNLIGWKDEYSDPTNQYGGYSSVSIAKLGSATVVRDGADATNGVVWGRWSAGYTTGNKYTYNGTTHTNLYTPVGGLAFITAGHITTDAELVQASTWPVGSGLLNSPTGGITGTYALAPGHTFVTSVNGVQSGVISSATATLNFTNKTVTSFNVTGSGGAFGGWSAGIPAGSGITFSGAGFTQMYQNGIPLSGLCSGGSGSCAGGGTAIIGSMQGGLVNTQAQGIIGTVGMVPTAQVTAGGGLTEALGGAVYLTRQAVP